MKRYEPTHHILETTPSSENSGQVLDDETLLRVTGGGGTKIEVDVGTPVNLPGGWRDKFTEILGY